MVGGEEEFEEYSCEELPLKILYAERSYRPAPTEVTYIPHSPVREYDYYAILELGGERGKPGLVLPLLVEVLTAEHEYGGKTAADKLLGVSMPVMFLDDEASDAEEPTVLCRGRVCPSRSAWTLPVTLGRKPSIELIELLSDYSSKTLYVPLVAKDFWDELVESQIVFAPSVYIEYVVEPLHTISKSMLSEAQPGSRNSAVFEDEVYRFFWLNLYLRTRAELCAHKGECEETSFGELRALEEFFDNRGETLATKALVDGVGSCSDIVVVLVIPSLSEAVKTAKMLGLRLSPPVATLATPILHIARVVKSRRAEQSTRLSILIVHDYGEEAREERDQIRKLKDYIERVLEEYGLEGATVAELYVGKPFSKIEVEEDLRGRLEDGLASVDCQRECAIVVVRDAEKGFLNMLLDIVSKMFERVYFVYAGETTPVYVEKACSLCIDSEQRPSHYSFPIASLLVYFSACIDEDEGKKVGELLRGVGGCEGYLQRMIFAKCDRALLERMVDCLARTSFVDVFRVK